MENVCVCGGGGGVWGGRGRGAAGGRERGEVCGRKIGSSLKRLYQRAVTLAHVLIGKKERGYSVIGCLIDSVHLTANLRQKKKKKKKRET